MCSHDLTHKKKTNTLVYIKNTFTSLRGLWLTNLHWPPDTGLLKTTLQSCRSSRWVPVAVKGKAAEGIPYRDLKPEIDSIKTTLKDIGGILWNGSGYDPGKTKQ